MDQQRQDHGAVRLALDRHVHQLAARGDVLILLGAGLAQHHRIDDLEVRRVGGERQVHLVAVELAVRRGTEVVLHVARTLDVLGVEGAALELVEQGAVRLVQHLGQDVQAAAVGHAENDVLDAEGTAALDDLLERRNGGFAAIEAEALGAGVLDVDELLEAFGLDQLVEDRLLALGGEGDFLVRALDALLNPLLGFGIGDVHELDAERTAIGALEDRQHLGDGGVFEPQIVVDEDLAAVVGLGEAVAARIEFRRRLVGLELERVEIGMQVSAHAVGADHHDGADGIAGGLQHVGDAGLGHAHRLCLLGDGLLGLDGDLAPIAVEGTDQVAAGGLRPIPPSPARALGVVGRGVLRVIQTGEEALPGLVDAVRVGLEAGVELLDVVGVTSIEEGGQQELVVLFLSCHRSCREAHASPSLSSAPALDRALWCSQSNLPDTDCFSFRSC